MVFETVTAGAFGSLVDRTLILATSPQSWNRYGYVLNSPLRFVDWFGLCPDPSVDCVMVSADAPPPPNPYYNDPSNGKFGSMGPNTSGGSGGVNRGGGPKTATACVQPTKFQQAGIKLQGWLAKVTNKTIGLGAGISVSGGNFMGVNFTVSQQLVVSPNGQAAFVTTFSNLAQLPFNAVTTPGYGVYGGLQISVSTAHTPQDLKGAAVDYGYGGGSRYGGGGDLSLGGSSLSITGTAGAGAGGVGHGFTTTTSTVVPIC